MKTRTEQQIRAEIRYEAELEAMVDSRNDELYNQLQIDRMFQTDRYDRDDD